MSEEFDERLKRAWVESILALGDKAAAAIALECSLVTSDDVFIISQYEGHRYQVIYIEIPIELHPEIIDNLPLRSLLSKVLQDLCEDYYPLEDFVELNEERHKLEPIRYRRRLGTLNNDWEQVIRRKIEEGKQSNQGLVSEQIGLRNGRPPLEYNELRYASQSEIRIAQELENKNVLFFPLAVCVRADTGIFWKDHREVDFLICQNGIWGILEVAYHPDRYEKDKEKDAWFKSSGILCIEHYPAERCFKKPSEVVDEFLSILQQHRR